MDSIAGYLDGLVGQTARKLIFATTPLGLVAGWTGIDTSSTAYTAGFVGGVATNILLTPTPLGAPLRLIQAGGAVIDGSIQIANGNVSGGLLQIGLGVLTAATTLPSSCAGMRYVSNTLTKVLGSTAASAGAQLLNYGLRGLGLMNGVMNIGTAVSQFGQGNILGGLQSLATGLQDVYFSTAAGACFTGETRVLTRRAWVRMDELIENDEVASCDENDPFGKIEFKPVLEVYRFPPARIWHVHVKGKVIRTTDEHPFYVWGKGWIAARQLEAGDRLRSDDGRTVAVEEVFDTGVEEPVYNCAVAEYHTYFVGSDEWGFSVWAHNACTEQARDSKGRFLSKTGGEVRPGSLAERATWSAIAKKPGWTVVEGGVMARNSAGQTRVYDGVAISPSGRVIGLEVKSGTGRRNAAQRTFDQQVNAGVPVGIVGQCSALGQIQRVLLIPKP